MWRNRILVVDVGSGEGELIGPVGAANPLWSPDGQLLAFSYPRDGRSVLAVMHPDGSGRRDISGDLGAFNASGANNWSPDGVWVYFGAERNNFSESHIYRAHVDAGYSEQLTFDLVTAAPALSPDGTTVAYSEWEREVGIQNLNVMDADGGNQRPLLDPTLNLGWSNDGQFLLAEWRPSGRRLRVVGHTPGRLGSANADDVRRRVRLGLRAEPRLGPAAPVMTALSCVVTFRPAPQESQELTSIVCPSSGVVTERRRRRFPG